LADEIGDGLNVETCRSELGLSDAARGQVLAVLPGSRAAEVQQLMPVFLEAIRQLQTSKPKLHFLVAAANDRLAGQIRLLADRAGLTAALDIRVGATRTVLGAADTVLLASGTATLETMLVRRPMVVAYRMNALTAWLARRLVKTEFVSLPNLLAGEALVPEFLQQEATPGALTAAVLEQLNSPEHSAAMVARFAELSEQLRCSASDRAADAVADVLRA
jgi:lipid-A-disaccharide synthase